MVGGFGSGGSEVRTGRREREMLRKGGIAWRTSIRAGRWRVAEVAGGPWRSEMIGRMWHGLTDARL